MKRKEIIITISALTAVLLIFVFSVLAYTKRPVTVEDYAMGSVVRATVYGEKNGEQLLADAVKKVKRLDSQQLSHTLSESYVYKLNRDRSAVCSEDFIKYIKNCMALSDECNGFTLLSGGLKQLWRTETGGYVPTVEEIKGILPQLSNDNIQIKGNEIKLLNGAVLDLGALGKGTACQTIIDCLSEQGVKNALCTVGGTVGAMGTPAGKRSYTIGVRNPFGKADEFVGKLEITDCYVSTSGNYEKYFEKDGVRYGHIFDSTVGKPVENQIASVTVVSDNGTLSDFLSTAVFILGETEGVRLVEKYNSQVIIIKNDKNILISSELADKFKLTDENFTVL